LPSFLLHRILPFSKSLSRESNPDIRFTKPVLCL
jgi:hypothetical protein